MCIKKNNWKRPKLTPPRGNVRPGGATGTGISATFEALALRLLLGSPAGHGKIIHKWTRLDLG